MQMCVYVMWVQLSVLVRWAQYRCTNSYGIFFFLQKPGTSTHILNEYTGAGVNKKWPRKNPLILARRISQVIACEYIHIYVDLERNVLLAGKALSCLSHGKHPHHHPANRIQLPVSTLQSSLPVQSYYLPTKYSISTWEWGLRRHSVCNSF